MLRTTRILTALLAVSASTVAAQPVPRQNGPVIRSAGEVFVIADPDIATPVDYTYRAVFEVAQTSEESGQVNVSFNSAARFLNMHAQAGVPAEQLHIALVVHGPAGRDLLNDAVYRERYGVANANIPVLDELARAGVKIIVCGQTAAARDLPRAALAEPVQMALSAMTAMVLLQDEGYRLIPF